MPENPIAAAGCSARWSPVCASGSAINRAFDIGGALIFFAFFGPLYLLVALAVLFSMGEAVHFWQNRLGSRNDGTQWDTFQKVESDPRITAIGRFIRKLFKP